MNAANLTSLFIRLWLFHFLICFIHPSDINYIVLLLQFIRADLNCCNGNLVPSDLTMTRLDFNVTEAMDSDIRLQLFTKRTIKKLFTNIRSISKTTHALNMNYFFIFVAPNIDYFLHTWSLVEEWLLYRYFLFL